MKKKREQNRGESGRARSQWAPRWLSPSTLRAKKMRKKDIATECSRHEEKRRGKTKRLLPIGARKAVAKFVVA